MLPYTALDALVAMRDNFGWCDLPMPDRVEGRAPRSRWFQRKTALAASSAVLAVALAVVAGPA